MAIKISSYNLNGIRAAHRKGLIDWFTTSQPDIVCFQELKATEDQVPDEVKALPYHAYYHSAVKKGYSGVAIFTKEQPLRIQHGMGVDWVDEEGRVILAEFESFMVVSLYAPSGTTGDVRQDMKFKWMEAFPAYVETLRKSGKPFVICGDFNIAHTEMDIHNPKANAKTSGFLPEERAWVTQFLKAGMHDVFRDLHPNTLDVYSWWSYRAASKSKNKGWRIDYHMANPEMAQKAQTAEIEKDWDLSDHAPVSITYNV